MRPAFPHWLGAAPGPGPPTTSERVVGTSAQAARGYWLVKSEPGTYSYSRLVEDGRTSWDGIRNFQARNNLRSMKLGDLALYYHSSEGKEIVGVARVARAAYQDPTTTEDWSAVDLEPVVALRAPVSLAAIKTS